MKKLIPFVLFLCSCGGGFNSEYSIEDDFIYYVRNFETRMNTRITIDIRFSDSVSDDYVAVCYSYNPKKLSLKNYIEVNPRHWEKLSDQEKELVIFHELGHCIFNRGHDSKMAYFTSDQQRAYGVSSMPKSIMYPNVFKGSTYSTFKTYYHDELENEEVNLLDYLR